MKVGPAPKRSKRQAHVQVGQMDDQIQPGEAQITGSMQSVEGGASGVSIHWSPSLFLFRVYIGVVTLCFTNVSRVVRKVETLQVISIPSPTFSVFS